MWEKPEAVKAFARQDSRFGTAQAAFGLVRERERENHDAGRSIPRSGA